MEIRIHAQFQALASVGPGLEVEPCRWPALPWSPLDPCSLRLLPNFSGVGAVWRITSSRSFFFFLPPTCLLQSLKGQATAVMPEHDNDDDFDDIPLQHKKPFGSGLRRNEIKFVPAGAQAGTIPSSTASQIQGQSVSDFYLNMVLRKPQASDSQPRNPAKEAAVETCEVCKMPVTAASSQDAKHKDAVVGKPSGGHHEASIAHQVCLVHSHPPSAVDRTRMGLSVLESQGWDPDARRGLGAAGQGVNAPIKAKPKDNNLGIGVVVPKDFERKKKDKEKPKLLDAKKVRKMAAEDRKTTDRLQKQIFGKIDLEKYLGSGA